MKRLLTILLAMCMLLSMSSISAFGSDDIGVWRDEAQLSEGAFGAMEVVVGDKIYVMGGCENSNELAKNSVRIFDTVMGKWEIGTPMLKATAFGGAAFIENKIYVLGGKKKPYDNTHYANVQVYDLNSSTWVEETTMPTAKSNFATAAVGNKIYLFGGSTENFNTSKSDVVDIYDTSKNTWSKG